MSTLIDAAGRVYIVLDANDTDEHTVRVRHLTDLGRAVAERGDATHAQLAREVRALAAARERAAPRGLSKGNLSRAETCYTVLIRDGALDPAELARYPLRQVYYAALAVADGRLPVAEVLAALADGDPRVKARPGDGGGTATVAVPTPAGVELDPYLDRLLAAGIEGDVAEQLDTVCQLAELVGERAKARGVTPLDWTRTACALDALRG